MEKDRPTSKAAICMASDINKRTPPVFPKLGVPSVRSQTAIVETEQQAANKILGGYASMGTSKTGPSITREGISEEVRSSLGMHFVPNRITEKGSNAAYSLSSDLRQKMGVGSPDAERNRNADLSTVQHENLHDVFNEISAIHGSKARQRLAMNLVHSIPDKFGGDIIRKEILPMHLGRSDIPFEETLARMHNLLNNQGERDLYRRGMKAYGKSDLDIESDLQSIKTAHKFLTLLGPKIDHKWLHEYVRVPSTSHPSVFQHARELGWEGQGTVEGPKDWIRKSEGIVFYVACDGDGIGRMAGRAVLTDDPDKLADVSSHIEAGETAIADWVESVGGRTIERGGDEVYAEIPAGVAKQIEDVRKRYQECSGATLSVGIGSKLSEASKALMVAKLRGKDRAVVYSPDIESEVDEATKPKAEAEKLAEEYLVKSEERPHPIIGDDVGHSETEEYGRHFKSGKPVSFYYIRNTGTSPKPGPKDEYQQKIEPHGRYMLHYPDHDNLPPGWEGGAVRFQNPLVLRFNSHDDSPSYDDTSWKARLSKVMKARGKALTAKLHQHGIDGIITVHHDRHGRPVETKEIVDLRPEVINFHKAEPKTNNDSIEHTHQLMGVHSLSPEGLRYAHSEHGGHILAPSIGVVSSKHPDTGFGNVTLVTPKDMVDPKVTPVFASDVYSPRHPRAIYELDKKGSNAVHSWLKPHHEAVSRKNESLDLEYSLRNGADDVASNRTINPALMHAFLKEKGIEPAVVTKQREHQHDFLAHPEVREYVAARDGKVPYYSHGTPEYKEFSALIDRAMKGTADAYRSDEQKAKWGKIADKTANSLYDDWKSYHFDSDGQLDYGSNDKIVRDLNKGTSTEVDTYQTEDNLLNAIEGGGMVPEFRKWAADKMRPALGKKFFYTQTKAGNRKKVNYTTANVLKEVTKGIRNLEGTSYGLGSARAMGTKKFADTEQLKRWGPKLVSADEFDETKTELNNRLEHLASNHKNSNDTWGGIGSDVLADVIAESYKKGNSIRRELAVRAIDAHPDWIENVEKLRRDLVDAPTQYFEAKPQRAVHLSEFRGAAIPDDDAESENILKSYGLHVEKYPKYDPYAKAEAINRIAQMQDLYLSERNETDLRKAEDTKRVSLVMVTDGYGRLLLGARNDKTGYTMPGGHLNPGEDPKEGAIREVREETSIEISDPTLIHVDRRPDIEVYLFSAHGRGEPTGANDPDQECEEWEWVDCRGGIPKNIWDNLSGPSGDLNLIRQVFDLKKSEKNWTAIGLL